MTARGGYSVIAVLGLGMAMPVGGVAAVRDRVTLPEGEQAIVRRVMSASDEIDAAQAKLRDRVSVLDYAGRVRLTNDVEVWSDAIAAALAEHETVVMPGGRTYVLDRTIVMPSNRRLEATGATVRLLAPAEVFVRTATDADGTLAPSVKPRGDNISVVGGRWCDWCTSRRQGIVPPPPVGEFHGMRAAFYLGNADHLAIEKVTVENAGGFGIQIDNADAVRLTGIRFERCRADGIHVDGNVSRIWIRDVRGEVDDDFIAFNGYDWLLGSVNFGPQRDILCEDVVPVDDVRHGYPSIRLLQGIYRYADGSKVDCRLSNAVFRNIRKVLTFKAYLHTQFFVIGEEPEFSEVGTIENIWFDDIDIDLVRPIDGKERCGLTVYSDSDPVRGHFAAFEFGTNADGVHFRNVKVRLHPDKWPLSHFMTVGPKSATFRRPNDGKTIEVFDPNVSCLVRGVTLENVSIEGAPSDRHFHETTFDDVNRDGRSSGRGRLEPPQTSSAFDRISSLERFGFRSEETLTGKAFAYVRDAGFNGVLVNGGTGFAPDQLPVESLVLTEAIPDLMPFTTERNRMRFRRAVDEARKAGVKPWLCWWMGLGAAVDSGDRTTRTFARRMGLELGAAYRRHPEFFGRGGVWRGNRPLCVSHPAVRAFYRELVARLAEEYPEIEGLFFFPGDSALEICSDECPTCAKTGLSRFERMMSFVNEMHAIWTKDRPRRLYYALWNIAQPCCRKYDEREITDVLAKLDPHIGIALTFSDIVRQDRASGPVALNQPWGICPEKGDQWRLLEARAGERPLMAVSEISQSELFDPVCGNMPFACSTLALLRNVASVRRADALLDFWGNRPPYAPDACHAVMRAWLDDPAADDETLLRRAAARHYGEGKEAMGVAAWRAFDRLMRTFPLCGWSQRFSYAIGREGARGPLYLPLVPPYLGAADSWGLTVLLQAGQSPATFERLQREAVSEWDACAKAFDGVSPAEADAIRLAGRLNRSIGAYVLARELYRTGKTDELRSLVVSEMRNREEQLRLSARIAPNSGVNATLVEEDLQNMSLYLSDGDFPHVPNDRFSFSDVNLPN